MIIFSGGVAKFGVLKRARGDHPDIMREPPRVLSVERLKLYFKVLPLIYCSSGACGSKRLTRLTSAQISV
eukprot:scaffold99340_cov81-Phaeocystis_antarctica.AAC.1